MGNGVVAQRARLLQEADRSWGLTLAAHAPFFALSFSLKRETRALQYILPVYTVDRQKLLLLLNDRTFIPQNLTPLILDSVRTPSPAHKLRFERQPALTNSMQ